MRAAVERAKAETANTLNTMPKKDMQLSASFSTNKGRLPWPSENGIISSTFGEHRHPVLKRVKTKNNGINILTNKGGVARSVFEGVVISVKYINQYKRCRNHSPWRIFFFGLFEPKKCFFCKKGR